MDKIIQHEVAMYVHKMFERANDKRMLEEAEKDLKSK
jgi:hypothetical protein